MEDETKRVGIGHSGTDGEGLEKRRHTRVTT